MKPLPFAIGRKNYDFVKWIKKLYRSAKQHIDEHLIEEIVNRYKNHPRCVQEFFYEIWAEKQVNFDVIETIERRILIKRIPEFAYVWDTLSLNQKRALKLLAGTSGRNIFSAENLSQFGFRAASVAP